jgi:hypothetical protein
LLAIIELTVIPPALPGFRISGPDVAEGKVRFPAPEIVRVPAKVFRIPVVPRLKPARARVVATVVFLRATMFCEPASVTLAAIW